MDGLLVPEPPEGSGTKDLGSDTTAEPTKRWMKDRFISGWLGQEFQLRERLEFQLQYAGSDIFQLIQDELQEDVHVFVP